MCQVSHKVLQKDCLTESSKQSSEIGIILISILQIKKMSLRGVKFSSHGHPAWSWVLTPICLDPEAELNATLGCFPEAHVVVQLEGDYMTTPPILSSGGGILCVATHTLVDSDRPWQMASIISRQWLFYFTSSSNIQHKPKYKHQIWRTMIGKCYICAYLSSLQWQWCTQGY